MKVYRSESKDIDYSKKINSLGYLVKLLRFIAWLSPLAIFVLVKGNFRPNLLSIGFCLVFSLSLIFLLVFEVRCWGCNYISGLNKRGLIQKGSVYILHFFMYFSVALYYIVIPVHYHIVEEFYTSGKYILPIGIRGKKGISCARQVAVKEYFLSENYIRVCAGKKEFKNLIKDKPLAITTNKEQFRGSAIFASSILGLSFVELKIESD